MKRLLNWDYLWFLYLEHGIVNDDLLTFNEGVTLGSVKKNMVGLKLVKMSFVRSFWTSNLFKNEF